ncbi:hypothetical protein CCACVL1_21388 [Corchorus capsularis]|uniref:Uncharacterized protein n=1 Tax=Corchorus capsularis TaxID=210143 RepID=A0A1R3H672_COCAP|nr:hypothetical protein CCACVL1_21388 [Corchorus capsularis]
MAMGHMINPLILVKNLESINVDFQ